MVGSHFPWRTAILYLLLCRILIKMAIAFFSSSWLIRELCGRPEICPQRFVVSCKISRLSTAVGAVNLAGAQRDRGVQGLGGLDVGGMGQAAAVSPVTSLKTANRRVISVR